MAELLYILLVLGPFRWLAGGISEGQDKKRRRKRKR